MTRRTTAPAEAPSTTTTAGAAAVPPDYTDESLAFGYLWFRHTDGKDAAFGRQLIAAAAGGLEEYAAERGSHLIGQPEYDFPSPLRLPRHVRQGVRRTLLAQERRPWRWPGMTLVRVWQDTAPVFASSPQQDS